MELGKQEKTHARETGTTNHENGIFPSVSHNILSGRDQREPSSTNIFWGWGSGRRDFFQKAAGSRNPNIASAFLGPHGGRWRDESVPRRERTTRCALPELLNSSFLLEKRRSRTLLVKRPFPRKTHFHRKHRPCGSTGIQYRGDTRGDPESGDYHA